MVVVDLQFNYIAQVQQLQLKGKCSTEINCWAVDQGQMCVCVWLCGRVFTLCKVVYDTDTGRQTALIAKRVGICQIKSKRLCVIYFLTAVCHYGTAMYQANESNEIAGCCCCCNCSSHNPSENCAICKTAKHTHTLNTVHPNRPRSW